MKEYPKRNLKYWSRD